MAKILVTGGSGMVGQILIPRLKNLGHEVDNYDLKEGKDIFNRMVLAKSLVGKNALIHLAGIGGPRAGEEYEPYRVKNLEGTRAVAEAAMEVGCPRLVFASSIAVYGVDGGRAIPLGFPIRETNPPPPNIHAYGRSKLEAEGVLKNFSSKELQVVCLRMCVPMEDRDFFTGSFREGEFWACTSPANLAQAFHLAVTKILKRNFLACNICNGSIPEWAVDIQEWIVQRWPQVPNKSEGQEALFSLRLAKQYLDYRPD